MRIEVVTLFPGFFAGPLGAGLVGKTLAAGRASVGFVDPREFTRDRHRSVDDSPCGGGAGMVMRPGPVRAAIALARSRCGGPVLAMTPQGRPLRQADLEAWARLPGLALVAGRYEGFDERILSHVDGEVSLGDFVLTGGEAAALAVIDGVLRLLPGTLGNEASAGADSFSAGLLEHPHYTRPVDLDGERVPEALLGGDHAAVAAWRHARALERTRARRPDLLRERGLDDDERRTLIDLGTRGPRLSLVVALDRAPAPATLADLARLAAAYDLHRATVVVPGDAAPAAREALALAPAREVPRVLGRAEARRLKRQRRARWPTVTVAPGARLEVLDAWPSRPPGEALVLGLARAAAPAEGPPVLGPAAAMARAAAEGLEVVLALGPGLPGDAPDAWLPSIRAGTEASDLPVTIAAAVALDRLRGEA
jgi:tRNA (guanine37-N1)-methyltransferase